MSPSKPSHLDLEVVENIYRNRDYKVKISIPEFSCVCPRTGLPDYAVIDIHYIPDKHIVELKSLKLYMLEFRNMGIFHEHVTNRILDDIVASVEPVRCEIRGDFNLRGGIKTVVRANFEREKTEDRNQKSGEARFARGETPR